MKINWKLVDLDMLDDIQIPKCPAMFKTQAELIIKVVAEMEPFSYSKISQFDKHLVVAIWKYDGLDKALLNPDDFKHWYISQATDPDLITRARRWLMEHNYLIATPSIAQMAQDSSEKWKASIRQ